MNGPSYLSDEIEVGDLVVVSGSTVGVVVGMQSDGDREPPWHLIFDVAVIETMVPAQEAVGRIFAFNGYFVKMHRKASCDAERLMHRLMVP